MLSHLGPGVEILGEKGPGGWGRRPRGPQPVVSLYPDYPFTPPGV